MPKLKDNALPKYRLHRQSGRGIVTLSGKDFLLPGVYDSDESNAEYNRLTGLWMANGRRLPQQADADIAVVEIVAAFHQHAKTYYRHPDGTPTSELQNFVDALRPLKRLFGRTPAAKFGPLALEAVRSEMIRLGWCRTHINRSIGRVKQVFKWAMEKELIPATHYHRLKTLSGLKAGRSDARESAPVQPVPEAHVHATLPHVSPQVAGMIELQLLTGMRPGEVCAMRGSDIDTTGKVWLYSPQTHKTQHHGHTRQVYLGPKAKEIVAKFLRPDLSAPLFSPADAMDWWREQRRKARKTPLRFGNREGTNRREKPQRKPGIRYTTEAYARAVYAGCDRAFAPSATLEPAALKAWKREHRWHPHQLRHTAGTRFRKEYGLEAAQVLLGHKMVTVTQLYAEKNVQAAQSLVERVG